MSPTPGHDPGIKVQGQKSKSPQPRPPGPLPAGLLSAGTNGSGSKPLLVEPQVKKAATSGMWQPERPAQASGSASVRCPSGSPASTTAGSSGAEGGSSSQAKSARTTSSCQKAGQVVWCDARAFKDEFQGLRTQLETATGVQAKSHKTAEKCIRLLRKKQRVRDERGRNRGKVRPLIFLVSWPNAQELVTFLKNQDLELMPAKVIIVCDTNGPKTLWAAERLSKESAMVGLVASTWAEAVQATVALLK